MDDDFDNLLTVKDVRSHLRSMSGTYIVHLARHAQSRMAAEVEEGHAEVDAEMQVRSSALLSAFPLTRSRHSVQLVRFATSAWCVFRTLRREGKRRCVWACSTSGMQDLWAKMRFRRGSGIW